MKRSLRWIGQGMGGLLVCLAVYVLLLQDTSAQPSCHKVLDTAFCNWMDRQGDDSVFPNIDGDGRKTLQLLAQDLGGEDLSDRYQYVPGLTRADPGDLVLLYLKQPTRWTWHGGLPPTIFHDQAWLIVPVDYCSGDSPRPGCEGEFSERLSQQQFQQRLQATLDYLQEQQRPGWETAVRQHSEFLQQLRRAAPD